jgi:hypothetical protein
MISDESRGIVIVMLLEVFHNQRRREYLFFLIYEVGEYQFLQL